MRLLAAALFLVQPVFSILENAEIHLLDRRPHSLRGFWDFRDAEKKQAGNWQKLRIDKEWRLQRIEGVSRSEFRLKIYIPQDIRTGDFGLILPPVSAAMKIFLNGKIVTEKGLVAADLRYPQNSSEAFAWYPVKLELLAEGNPQDLVIEITGFQGGGGIYGNTHIYFGGAEEIREKFNFLFLVTAFVAAAIFMIAVFHFALVPDRNYRRANLHYVLLSLAMSFHILGMNGLGYYICDNFAFNAALIHTILAVFPFTLIGFSLRFFRLSFPRVRIASYAFACLMGGLLLACAIRPGFIPYYLDYGLPLGFLAMAVSLSFSIYAAFRGVMGRTEGARLIFSGFVIYSLTVINDILSYFSYITPYTLADLGFLAAVLCIAVALADRLQRSTQEKEELGEWKKEISLAARIQSQALAKRSISNRRLSVDTLFKPMKIIGGDFFAFHEISEEGTGIFIADVSGHGIPAALMVNTIHSIFLQQRECALDPGQFMRKMNQAIYPQLHEQFITAAYCVLDFGAGKIRIAQAGHPPICLLRQGSGQLEKVKPKGRFFGFAPEIDYETVELDLAGYSRIFLYSDGVIEAGWGSGSPYTQSRLESFLVSTADLEGRRLLSGLEADIRLHTNTLMNTDDDSSCIVVDLKAA